ncbi:hypothetical protein GGF40_000687 [Coemansia sp. RSA 1286]|nr:hypothetical protein GGF40_000687 [Coemansia sp. RSA 1286]
MCCANSSFNNSVHSVSSFSRHLESSDIGFIDMHCHHSQAYQCSICGAVFGSAYDASEHVKEMHFFPEL